MALQRIYFSLYISATLTTITIHMNVDLQDLYVGFIQGDKARVPEWSSPGLMYLEMFEIGAIKSTHDICN